MKATKTQEKYLNALYEGKRVFYGELHDHSASGGTSDGKRPLSHWLGAMEALGLDFAAILDHRQVRHMCLPEWVDGVFLGGTELGTAILDANAAEKHMHYNMIFENAEDTMKLLKAFPEFEFTGGEEGHFIYPSFTRERFMLLAKTVFDLGGFFVHPHPKQLMDAENPCEYVFCDGMGLEVIYVALDSNHTTKNYKLWVDLLALGKKVYATAGCDLHACCHNSAITTLYATEKKNKCYLAELRAGNFTAGSVGIRMCIGNTCMGGTTAFADEKLIVSIDDFHKSVKDPIHRFRVDVITDTGVCYSKRIPCDKPTTFALDVDSSAKFYRVEVVDVSRDLRIAIGNPIWNQA